MERWYIAFLGEDCRRRHFHRRVGKWIVEFSVQLEILINNTWRPIIRYDTEHGFFHRDYYHPTGKKEKIPINITQLNEALTFAENDIRANWLLYKEQFLKEITEG